MDRYLLTIAPRIAAPDGVLRSQRLFLIEGDLGAANGLPADEVISQLAAELLSDPVVQQADWQRLNQLVALNDHAGSVLEVAYRPGVTDSEADSVLLGAQRIGLAGLRQVRTLRRWHLPSADAATEGLLNPLIQLALRYEAHEPLERRQAFYAALLLTPAESPPLVATVALRKANDDELLDLSRRGVLALDLNEMRAVQAYFRSAGRDPSDGELETIAQTWSEHCSHKTFKALVHYTNQGQEQALDATLHPALHSLGNECTINSLLKTFLMTATEGVLEAHRAATGSAQTDWVLSAFVDNAGIIAFSDDYEVSFKVETHNHPSALEPFGGANTGVGGVVRDVLGVSARPIANTDVLCFGPLDLPDAALPDGVLPPRRTYAGVVAGVRDYGNKLGIPTVNGAVLFDTGYTANPLVYCGTVGLAPRGRHPRNVCPGDTIVVAGGRTGRDGIHGATFSSIELTHTTAGEVGSAVQIGDPITEKRLIDVILQARDLGLYNAITDCGAGGLSSAVGEMGAEMGATVDLTLVPRKYPGLLPWEAWLSEAQERMVLAVPPEHLPAFLALCAAEDVEASAIGTFEPTGRLLVRHSAVTVVDLAMDFLHDGLPRRQLDATWSAPSLATPERVALSPQDALLALLAHPNIASKERIVRSYDHEVQGATIVKPLVGVRCDGPGDAAVLQPLRNHWQGLALGCGINPNYGKLDPYWMALACVDEALRNVVAVGGDPTQAAILDNFCWGDPRRPDRMAGLVRAAAGCHDAALAFGTPFISGKDSLNNEYRGPDGARIPIPPTLLISALAIVPDVRQATTMDTKEAGNLIYLLGETREEWGGSHYAALVGAEYTSVPQVDLSLAPRLLRALHQAIRAGLVRACHDLSEGGLAVAAAEMSFAGGLGMTLDLAAANGQVSDEALLFAESPSRLLVEVAPAATDAFEQLLRGIPCARIGMLVAEPLLAVRSRNGATLLHLPLDTLRAVWQAPLADAAITLPE